MQASGCLAWEGIMKHLIQPNRWSCLPTSFAMVLDTTVEDIIEYIGHDGSEILWPTLIEPLKRKAFHPQEMIEYAFNIDMAVITFEMMPCSQPHYDVPALSVWYRDPMPRMLELLGMGEGVLSGTTKRGSRHAVAWDGQKILDPNGTSYDLSEFCIETFYMVKKTWK